MKRDEDQLLLERVNVHARRMAHEDQKDDEVYKKNGREKK